MERRSERPRALNFSKEEESLLLRIVKNHNVIIENKKTDSVTNAMKVKEWLLISEIFNSQKVGQPRDAATLRRKYENIKRGVKKNIKEGRASVNKTGGDQPSKISFNKEENNLLEIIGPKAIGLESVYDDDTHQNQIPGDPIIIIDNKQNELNIDNMTPLVNLEPDSGKENVSRLENEQPNATTTQVPLNDSRNHFRPYHPLLKKRKKNSHPIDKINAWATYKAQIAEDDKVHRKEIHDKKIKLLNEEYKMKQEEHKMKLEEHEMRMRHAKEQQAWLREEHLQRLKNLKESSKAI